MVTKSVKHRILCGCLIASSSPLHVCGLQVASKETRRAVAAQRQLEKQLLREQEQREWEEQLQQLREQEQREREEEQQGERKGGKCRHTTCGTEW
jgi:hypothetical protein